MGFDCLRLRTKVNIYYLLIHSNGSSGSSNGSIILSKSVNNILNYSTGGQSANSISLLSPNTRLAGPITNNSSMAANGSGAINLSNGEMPGLCALANNGSSGGNSLANGEGAGGSAASEGCDGGQNVVDTVVKQG